MGRAARAKRETRPAAAPAGRRIPLERTDYLELSMLGERVQRMELEARAAAATFAQRIGDVTKRRNALLLRLGQQHGFHPHGQFRLEDADHALVIEESTPAAAADAD